LGAHELVITWSTAGLIENFTFSQALDNPFTITPVNGANTQYKKGGNILLSVYEVGSPDKLININPIKAKPNSSEQATFFIKDIVKNRMDSGLPAFSCNDQPYKITGHKKDFYFKYTSVENLETCGVKYGEINGSDNFTVYNVVLDDSSEYFLVPYLFQNIAQIGVKFVKWLTYRGNISKISCNTCGYVNIIHSFNNTAQIKYETFEYNVSTGVFTHPTLISGSGTWAIPLNLNQSFIPANTDKISVWISNGVTDLSEKLTFAIDRECCDDNNELYFLNDLGVYEVLHFDSIQSVDIETIAEETCAMINQSDSYNLRMQNNGKSLINIESTETYTIVTSENQRTKWYLDMIKQLAKSPSVFMRYSTGTGTFKRKISILPNSFTVYSKDERLFNEFRIRFHNDVKIANF
jgi:hypothetical protein